MYDASVSEKLCSKCKNILPASEFYPHRRMKSGLQPQCRACSREWHRQRPDYIREKNKQFKLKYPEYHRDWHRRRKFGVEPSQINAIRDSQDGLCAGCLRDLAVNKECVDHCHDTGRIRGLLCNDCNVSIGILGDNPETLRRLADYIEKNKT